MEGLRRTDEPNDLDDGSASPTDDRPPQDDERPRDTERDARNAEEHGKLKEPGMYYVRYLMGGSE